MTSSSASNRAGEDESARRPRVRAVARCLAGQLPELDDDELLVLAAAGVGVAGVDELDELELEAVPESLDVELEPEFEVVLAESVEPFAVVDELFDELEPDPPRLSVL